MHGEVIGEIAEPAIVEVEEPGLSGQRSLGDDVGVDAVAIAMTADPAQPGPRADPGIEPDASSRR
jgi:hypothetical protein